MSKTLPYVKALWSTPALIIYFITSLVGIVMVLGRFDEYVHTFSYFFNFEGALAYGAAIFFIKVVHELSHAYTAKNYQLQVPSIGVVFICMWPVLYTDVTNAWRLPKRKDRLVITVAGVCSELVIAGLSTFGWAISPPGILQTVFFLLSSITWITSILININPAMRFDGYYLLSDILGVDNLRPRAFAVTRWKWHEWLFGFGRPCPEEALGKEKVRQLWIYGFASWIYLAVVFWLIALLIYHMFTKALGIALFTVEIGVFFVWPVVWEAQYLYRLREYFRLNRNLLTTLTVTALIVAYFCFPWRHDETFVGVAVPADFQELWAANQGIIKEIHVKRGQKVSKGELLVKMISPTVDASIKTLEADILEKQQSLNKWALEPDKRSYLAEGKAALQAVQFRLDNLKRKQEELIVKSSLDGIVYYWDETLKEGQPVGSYQLLGKVADPDAVDFIAFVPESNMNAIKLDEKVLFSLLGSPVRLNGIVTEIGSSAAAYLEYPALASTYKGPLPTTVDQEQKLKMVNSYFPVRVRLQRGDGDPEYPLYGKVGVISVKGPSESILMHSLRYVWSVIVRESGL